jgi:hypothetical protein
MFVSAAEGLDRGTCLPFPACVQPDQGEHAGSPLQLYGLGRGREVRGYREMRP